jgi:WD40 repeat protein/predicted Ser/Thr protein kinase
VSNQHLEVPVPPHREEAAPQEGEMDASQVPLEWQVGDVILGLYEVQGELGRGGMGVVYKVRHRGWDMELAVKSPLQSALDRIGGEGEFIAEAEAWIDLGLHPHIVTCYYVRKLGPVPRLFAEYVQGGSLSEWIKNGKLRDLEGVLDAAIQFAWGLDYAHQMGLVHKDIKPANVLMTADGQVKVTDFGQAKAKAGYTPAYCSPEQAAAQLDSTVELTPATDVWSWALSILEVFAGSHYWVNPAMPEYAWGQVAPQALQAYLDGEVEEGAIAHMPESLSELLAECFRETPDERPESMGIVAERLVEIYAGEIGRPYSRELPKAADLRAGSLNNKALSLLDLGREIDAAKQWEEALRADERHPESAFNYGITRWRNVLISDEELINQLEFSLSAHPSNWQALYNLGMAHIERGDIEAAAASFRQAAQINSEEPMILDALLSIKSLTPSASCVKTIEVESHTSTALVRDRPHVGTAGQTNQPTVWDLNSGEPDIRISRLEDPELPVIAISSDGRYIFEGGYKKIRLWDTLSYRYGASPEEKQPHVFEIMSPLRALAISPDNLHALSGEMEGTVTLYDLLANEEIDELAGHEGDVRFVGFSDDGKWVITGGDDGGIIISSLSSGMIIHEFTGPAVWSVAISDDNRWIASACRDHTIRLLDLETMICPRILMGHKDEVRSVAISSDMMVAISGSADKTVRIWDLVSGRCLRTLEGHSSTVHAVFLLPKIADGLEVLTAADDGDLKIWQLTDNRVNPGYWAISMPTSYSEAATLARTGRAKIEKIQSALQDGDLERARAALMAAREIPGFENDPELLELTYQLAARIGERKKFTGVKPFLTIKDHIDTIDQIAVTDDGRYLIADGHEFVVWDLQENRLLNTVPGSPYARYPARPIVLTPDSKYLVATQGKKYKGLGEPDIGLWDLEIGAWAQVLPHDTGVVDFQLHPNGSDLITLAYSKNEAKREIHVWNLQTGKKSSSRACDNQADRFLVSDNGHHVIAVQNEKSVAVSDSMSKLESSLAVISLEEERENFIFKGTSLPFVKSPDPRFAAASGPTDLVILDIEKGQPAQLLSGSRLVHPRSEALKFTHDGRYLLAPHQNGIGIWEVETGNLINLLNTPDCDDVLYTLLSEDSEWVLATGSTGYEQSSIYLWHLESAELIHTLRVFSEVFSFSLYRNDRFLAVSGVDDIRIWQLTWEFDFPAFHDWDERARAYLDIFLTLNTPYSRDDLTRPGRPQWAEADFQNLLHELSLRGYGWLRPEGVLRKLEELAAQRV